MKKKLSELKKGDFVKVSRRQSFTKDTVERTTKTQIVLESGGKFRISDGIIIGGDSWSFSHISHWTSKDEMKFLEMKRIQNTKKLIAKVSSVNPALLSEHHINWLNEIASLEEKK